MGDPRCTDPKCPLVIIRWLDSRQPTSAWRHLADVGEPQAVECATVGWLLKDNTEVKVICQSVGDLGDPENAQANGIMTIPTRCVLAMERLEEIDVSPTPPKKYENRAKGGHARARVLNPARRSEIARDAALARWASPERQKEVGDG